MRADRRPGPTTRVDVVEWRGEVRTEHEDRLASEEPLELRLTWPGHAARRWLVTMRTPGHDFELAAGLAHGEGLLAGPDPGGRLVSAAYCTEAWLLPEQRFNVVTLTLREPPAVDPPRRQGVVSAACGVCGRDSVDAVAAAGGAVLPPTPPLRRDALSALPGLLRERQQVFARTGGLHGAGLFTPDAVPLVVREDVGRHNAVDKVIGHRLLGAQSTAGLLLATSGRVGYEIVQKAVLARVAAVVAVGAPSSLAVDLAHRFGLTVAGWVRDGRMVVYATPDRIG